MDWHVVLYGEGAVIIIMWLLSEYFHWKYEE